MIRIRYKSGYRYQLAADVIHLVAVRPGRDVIDEYIRLDRDGTLVIKRGYAWDGASGPAINTRSFRRGSLVHDALYQLMRRGMVSRDWREAADRELRRICLEDGMYRVRAWWVYRAVRLFGRGSASKPRPVQVAP